MTAFEVNIKKSAKLLFASFYEHWPNFLVLMVSILPSNKTFLAFLQTLITILSCPTTHLECPVVTVSLQCWSLPSKVPSCSAVVLDHLQYTVVNGLIMGIQYRLSANIPPFLPVLVSLLKFSKLPTIPHQFFFS